MHLMRACTEFWLIFKGGDGSNNNEVELKEHGTHIYVTSIQCLTKKVFSPWQPALHTPLQFDWRLTADDVKCTILFKQVAKLLNFGSNAGQLIGEQVEPGIGGLVSNQ